MSERVIHACNWSLNYVESNLKLIKDQGFTAIQLSPMQDHKKGNEWWKRYQPINFKIGNDLGSKEDLIRLCDKANNLGLKIIVDVVGNNVAGLDNGEVYPHKDVDIPLEYFKPFKTVGCWEDRQDYITNSIGIPCLNTKLKQVQELIFNYIDELIECGVKGVRMDASKHIALPSEGSNFWINFKNRFENRGLFNYGEVIFEKQNIIDEYAKYINVLTNMGYHDKNKIVTFAFSHDSDLTFFYTQRMSDVMCINEYRIICENFPNSVWYCRPFNNTWMDKRIKEANLMR